MSYQIPEIALLDASDLKNASEQLHSLELQSIACNNWSDSFPYAPKAAFQMAHNGQELFIRFSVQEDRTMALITQDNGDVWTDSCVEFFIALDESGYYNFEFSCIGKALLGFRKERPTAVHASADIMHTIKRLANLGSTNFKEKQILTPWELTVAIPITALFRHQIKSWKGLTAHINIYKCGDHLSTPHYLSWKPIDTPTPDFHIPRCFTEVKF
ncbi:MAG: carbohydrate-binding family 9-like protein [Odoribacter sp.]